VLVEVSAGDAVGGMGSGRVVRRGIVQTGVGITGLDPMLSPMLDTGEGLIGDVEALVLDVLASVVEALVCDVSDACSELAR
jgi:F420-0:gamma-glutamyl ligase